MSRSVFKSLQLHIKLSSSSNGEFCRRSFCTATGTVDKILNYLINSLGFSPDSALATAKKLRTKRIANPESVVYVLKNYGFTPDHIASIFTKVPNLLSISSQQNLQPKLEFLAQNGISGRALVNTISADPFLLNRSLNNQIVPSIEFLRSFFSSTSEIVSLFSVRRGTWVVHKFSETTAPNVETLRAYGVPDINIARIICIRPAALSRDVEGFRENVGEIKDMGFNPSGLMFIHGLCTLSGMKKDKWNAKFEVFKSFGWSEEEIRGLFVRQPKFMNASDKRMQKSLDFFMNKLGLSKNEIYRNPIALSLSFEKRVLPRTYLLQQLASKGVFDKVPFIQAFCLSEDRFLARYVMAYIDRHPNLLDLYRKKMEAA